MIELYLVTGAQPSLRPTPKKLVADLGSQGKRILCPDRERSALMAQWTKQADDWQLPATRARVQDRTIDLMGCDQGVLLLNNLNWFPRPVFQSYAAYTPGLLQINADHFRGDGGPDFVLWRPAPIDGHLPMLEDNAAILEILYRYRPVLAERRWLLLERGTTKSPRPSGAVVLERSIIPGESVSLERTAGRYQTLALEIDPSFWAKVRAATYHPSAIRIKLRLADGTEHVYRLIPKMARSEFLLNPLCEDSLDLLKIYQDAPQKRVVSLSLDMHRRDAVLKPGVKMTIREYSSLVQEKISEADVDEWSKTLSLAPSDDSQGSVIEDGI